MDTIKIIIDTNAEDAAKSFENLSESFEDTTKSSEDLRKQIRGLKNELYKLTPGTTEYIKVLNELGSKMDQLGDTQQELRVATGGLDMVFESTTRATASLAGGFTAALGVVTLFGGESENLQKALVKLQAAMNVLKGLKEFASFPKMFNRMVTSIKAYSEANEVASGISTTNTVVINAETASYIGNSAAKAKSTLATASNTESVNANTQSVTTNTLALEGNEIAAKGIAVARVILDRLLAQGKISEDAYGASVAKTTEMIYRQVAATGQLSANEAKLTAIRVAMAMKQKEANAGNSASENASFVSTVKATKAKEKNTAAEAANTTATETNTKAKVKNAAATEGQAAATETATKATSGFGASLKSLGGLLGKLFTTPIGLAALAIAGLTAAFVYAGKEQKKAKEFNDEYKRSIAQLPPPIDDADAAMNRYIDTLDKYDRKLQALGISDERRSEIRTEALEKEKERLEKQLEDIAKKVREKEQEIDDYYQNIHEEIDSDNADIVVAMAPQATEKESKALKELKQAAIDANNALQTVNEELAELANTRTPESVKKLNDELKELANTFKVSIAGGLATTGDEIQAKIDVYKKAYNDLFLLAGGMYRIKGNTSQEQSANRELAASYQEKIKELEVELAAYNAGLAKKARESAASAAATLNGNFKKITDDINSKVDDYIEAWKKALEMFANLGNLSNGDDLTIEQSIGRAISEANRYGMDIETYIEEWKKNAKKALEAGEISEELYGKLLVKIDEAKQKMADSLRGMIDKSVSDEMIQAGNEIQSIAETFKKDNEAMMTALSGGLITSQEYESFLTARINEYRGAIGPKMEEAKRLIDEEVAKAAPEDQERLRKILESFFGITDNVIPPDVVDDITNTMKSAIDRELQNIEDYYSVEMDKFEQWSDQQAKSWVEGGDTSYWGDSASMSYKKSIEENKKLYDLLHAQYQEEIDLLEEKLKTTSEVLGEDSAEYAEYYAQLQALRDADTNALNAKNNADLASMREYGQNVIEMAGQFGDAVSGLASAMGDYYAEQAEQAKEMYGENSEEYKKYLKKEGNMKIAQVWTDAATGIMSAWATSESLGPIAGPILAAIQTAALLATAVASTQQIKRQTQANASGGASTANVSGITDRVIFGEAQNADQQAQLNGQYSAGNQRVYVVESDINDAQRSTRTAVTGNIF